MSWFLLWLAGCLLLMGFLAWDAEVNEPEEWEPKGWVALFLWPLTLFAAALIVLFNIVRGIRERRGE